jgi:feruloyl-CoA synthase
VSARYRPVSLGGSLSAQFETRADGAIIVTSTEPLGPYPRRLTDRLLHWAAVAPERSLAAKRVAGGEWRHLSYGQALASARSIA